MVYGVVELIRSIQKENQTRFFGFSSTTQAEKRDAFVRTLNAELAVVLSIPEKSALLIECQERNSLKRYPEAQAYLENTSFENEDISYGKFKRTYDSMPEKPEFLTRIVNLHNELETNLFQHVQTSINKAKNSQAYNDTTQIKSALLSRIVQYLETATKSGSGKSDKKIALVQLMKDTVRSIHVEALEHNYSKIGQYLADNQDVFKLNDSGETARMYQLLQACKPAFVQLYYVEHSYYDNRCSYEQRMRIRAADTDSKLQIPYLVTLDYITYKISQSEWQFNMLLHAPTLEDSHPFAVHPYKENLNKFKPLLDFYKLVAQNISGRTNDGVAFYYFDHGKDSKRTCFSLDEMKNNLTHTVYRLCCQKETLDDETIERYIKKINSFRFKKHNDHQLYVVFGGTEKLKELLCKLHDIPLTLTFNIA